MNNTQSNKQKALLIFVVIFAFLLYIGYQKGLLNFGSTTKSTINKDASIPMHGISGIVESVSANKVVIRVRPFTNKFGRMPADATQLWAIMVDDNTEIKAPDYDAMSHIDESDIDDEDEPLKDVNFGYIKVGNSVSIVTADDFLSEEKQNLKIILAKQIIVYKI